MGILIIIIIVGVVILFVVSLTDTSPVRLYSYNYVGIIGGADIMTMEQHSTISIQQKFITIRSEPTFHIKMRIFEKKYDNDCICYSCVDEYRKNTEILHQTKKDAIIYITAGIMMIYTNDPEVFDKYSK